MLLIQKYILDKKEICVIETQDSVPKTTQSKFNKLKTVFIYFFIYVTNSFLSSGLRKSAKATNKWDTIKYHIYSKRFWDFLTLFYFSIYFCHSGRVIATGQLEWIDDVI